jgi:hypothetical protein
MYGQPRATKDIDFLILINDENLENLKKALIDFNSPIIDVDHLREKGNGIRIGVSPIRIDIITEASGIDFEKCYSRRQNIIADNIEISLISKADLIINKISTGRPMDLGDVEKLGYIESI